MLLALGAAPASAQKRTSSQLVEKLNRMIVAHPNEVKYWDGGVYAGSAVRAEATGPCSMNLVLKGNTGPREYLIRWDQTPLVGTEQDFDVVWREYGRDQKIMLNAARYQEFVGLIWAIARACPSGAAPGR